MIDSVSESANASPDLKRTRRAKTDGGHRTDTVQRLPPHDLNCEIGILGCILVAINPNEPISICIARFKMGEEVFFDLQHQTIYKALLEMYEKRVQIDLITLRTYLNDKQLLDQVGGLAYLTTLPDAVPSSSNLSYYTEFVYDKYLLRRAVRICSDAIDHIYNYTGESVDEMLDGVERQILSIRQTTTNSKDTKQLVDASMDTIESMFHLKGRTGGLPTGFTELDRLTDGLHPGDMIALSGYEKMGKTSLAMNIVEHFVLELKLPVGVFNLEMTGESLMTRVICSNARVNLRDVRDGVILEGDFARLTGTAAKLRSAALFINDASDLTILQLRAEARRMVQLYGIKLLVVDYLQLLSAPEIRKKGTREQEISSISKGIKAMAKDLGLPVIVLSQQNEEGKLRESQAIAQDADGWWQLEVDDDRDSADKATRNKNEIPVNLRVKRQRNGPTGDVELVFHKTITRFEPASPISESDLPL